MRKVPKIILLIETSTGDGRSVAKGIAKYASLHGPWTFARILPYYRELSNNNRLSELKEWGADGIILRQSKINQPFIDMGIPTIYCSNLLQNSPNIRNLPSIVTDDLMIGKMGAEYMLGRGFTNFAFCGLDNTVWSTIRGESFADRVQQAGFQTNIYKQPKSKIKRFRQAEQPILIDWLKSLSKPIGLFTCNDDRALEIIEACKLADIHIPQEIAVLGVGNDELACELSNPPLSSIARDNERTGYEAAELLDKLMHGEEMANQKIIMEPLYTVTRQSTNILAIEDSDVAEAIHYIRENTNRIIQVRDVVDATVATQRVLQKKFRKFVNRSINDEIINARVDHICRMLVETNLSISQIVLSMGYSDINHISRCFKRVKGITPLAYRKKYSHQ